MKDLILSPEAEEEVANAYAWLGMKNNVEVLVKNSYSVWMLPYPALQEIHKYTKLSIKIFAELLLDVFHIASFL